MLATLFLALDVAFFLGLIAMMAEADADLFNRPFKTHAA
jgi:hypothetical protein